LTLSPAQAQYAADRLRHTQSADRTEIRLEDYRDCTGMYDRIVSVEMFEAVGVAYWPTFFDVLNRRLAPDGHAVLQIITIDAARFSAYAQQADFIQKHIFPGGMLPTREKLVEQGEKAGLVVEEIEHFGLCYARTLAEWATRFDNAWPALRDMGFSEIFKRKWLYYLAYCEAGCRSGTLDVGLYRFKKRIAP
jgi:cyclopropane-fatty-acyl-phospholipid synthase